MKFWTVLFACANALLCIRILFFSDKDRRESTRPYRLLLFLVAIYVAWQVITVSYHPQVHVHAVVALFHIGLLVAALAMRPEYLPGNCSYDATKQAYLELGHTVSRTWYGLRRQGLHGRQSDSGPPSH